MTGQSSDKSGRVNPLPAEIKRIIADSRTIAVVGLSSDRSRPSYRVARYLQKQGYVILPVNPRETEVLGQPAYPDLASVAGSIDIVQVFRKSEEAPAIVAEAIAKGAACIWLQEGVISPDASRLAGQAGIPIVMDRCLKREYQRWRRKYGHT